MAYPFSACNSAGHLDPFLPLAAGNYFHQIGESSWRLATAKTLTSLLQSASPPEFRTILACDHDFACELPPAELQRVGYVGAFYADFDGEGLDEVCPKFRAFLTKLEHVGVDLDMVRLFATGGRGFHVEVPMACFVADVPTDGIPGLPYIYREMAFALYVDTLDVRVYSAKRGRMWRVPNRRRANGAFKVPLTTAEAKAATPDTYHGLVAAPRPFPPLVQPQFCPGLAKIYADARDKDAAMATRKRAVAKQATEFSRRFSGRLPPSIAALGAGRLPARGGWNLIAMQLSLTALACGMDEDALVNSCHGLIHSHQSDGHRYNTWVKREAELRRMYGYCSDTPAYEASAAGLRAVLPKGLRCNDLRGL